MSENLATGLVDYLVKHYGSIKSRLGRIVGNPELASDALQDTWLRLQVKPEQDVIQNPGGYILRIGVNIAIDIQRRQSRSVSLDEVNAAMELADPAPATEDVVQARAAVAELLRHIDLLPRRQRSVILMVHVDGLTQKEIAARLDISLRTVESDLKKAQDTLIEKRSKER
ncbi:RNA polymerase sigma factor [Herbaspirillum sp. alder98]|uniref:RNA polymerase sigma factor n=1 Tax=Herbaspirillum sp. alder98 TaxID=2913096 RepID=UPI001CD8F0F4|nr:RNA polymerase sigma factor [Herbaspirillum sp. alder98]MCA1325575.1 RNA polymerase sigma factor [Herbaspirillum sp. alder98]